MELIAQGVSICVASRELDVARSGAHRWLHGGTIMLKDGRVKHTPTIDMNHVFGLRVGRVEAWIPWEENIAEMQYSSQFRLK